MRVAYGYEKQDDELVTLVNHVMECAGLATQPSRFWVNIMPWRKFHHPISIIDLLTLYQQLNIFQHGYRVLDSRRSRRSGIGTW